MYYRFHRGEYFHFKYLSLVVFISIIIIDTLLLPLAVLAEHDCKINLGPIKLGCSEHPPTPPSPQQLTISCDGRRNANINWALSPTCTDVNNIRGGELMTVEGRNFTPDAKVHTSYIKLANGSISSSEIIACNSGDIKTDPNGVFVKADGGGYFCAIVRISQVMGKEATTLPGNYPYYLKATRPAKAVGKNYFPQVIEEATTNVHIAEPLPPPPSAPKLPPPAVTPPPAPGTLELKNIPLTLDSLEVGLGPTYVEVPEAQPPFIEKGKVPFGYPFVFSMSGFHEAYDKDDRKFNVYIDDVLFKKDLPVGWLSTAKMFFVKKDESTFTLGTHRVRVTCTNCPFRAGQKYTSDRDGRQYVSALPYNVAHEGSFEFTVVPAPPGEEIILPSSNELTVGDIITVKGKNFIPGKPVPHLLMNDMNGSWGVDMEPIGRPLIAPDTTYTATYSIPLNAGQMVKGKGEVLIRSNSSSFGNTLRRDNPLMSPNRPYVLNSRCLITEVPSIKTLPVLTGYAAPTSIDLTRDSILVIEATNFTCNDSLTVSARVVGGAKSDTFAPAASVRQADYLGSARPTIYTSEFVDHIDLKSRKVVIDVTDTQGRTAGITLDLKHRYGVELSPKKLVAGETFFVSKWWGFSNNAKVTVSLPDKRLKSVYLDPKDPPEITVPVGTKPGVYTVEVSNTYLFGLLGGGTALEDIEVIGEIKKEIATEEKAEEIKNIEAENKKTEQTDGKIGAGIETKKYGDVETKKFGGEQTKKTAELETKEYLGDETEGYGDVENKQYGEIETKKYGDVETKTSGDVKTSWYDYLKTKLFGDTEVKKYNDVDTKVYGEVQGSSYGEVKTPTYGDVNTKNYDGVESKTYGEVETKNYGTVESKSYGDVETKQYGNVKAPTYEQKETPEGICNPLIPKMNQPNCKESPTSFLPTSLAAVKSLSKPIEKPLLPVSLVAGTYVCKSYNVSGGGGSCRNMRSLILNKDGSYTFSTERGTYKVEGTKIKLSQSRIRGDGVMIRDTDGGIKLVFKYIYGASKWKHELVYYKKASAPAPKATVQVSQSKVPTVPIPAPLETLPVAVIAKVVITFPDGDYTPKSANVLMLRHPDLLNEMHTTAVYVDEHTLSGSFWETPPGRVYDLLVSTGFSSWKIGVLDTTKATKDFKVDLIAKTEK